MSFPSKPTECRKFILEQQLSLNAINNSLDKFSPKNHFALKRLFENSMKSLDFYKLSDENLTKLGQIGRFFS